MAGIAAVFANQLVDPFQIHSDANSNHINTHDWCIYMALQTSKAYIQTTKPEKDLQLIQKIGSGTRII